MMRDTDTHPLDSTVRIFGSRGFIVVFTVISISLGCVLSVTQENWVWLGRFGSLISISGLLATSSPLFIKGIYKSQSGAGRLASMDERGRLVTTTAKEREIGDTMILGIAIAVLGGLVGAFGEPAGEAIYTMLEQCL
ncbi:hypothetical protein [Castellaniella sp.]|uniref:hypothetical protein n=1 Tax=Castellaniella sp. TaxID=1955812 RepID=UPI002AFFDD30|nr:hypothetical protein [Castellaniella sp.]